MATIILGAAGRAIAGPIGGIIGSLAGGFVDRSLFSGGGVRDVGRSSNPLVQSSAYGEAIALVVGRMRIAGNLIWSSGIAERVDAIGGGKGGSATNQYSYSASFAVGLSARRVLDIARVWADGRLIRNAEREWLLPIQMRLHSGSEQQTPDPLIAAAEGEGGAPAYRGLAYVVFEDMPLSDFGNRIPILTFEITADPEQGLDFGTGIAIVARESVAQALTVSVEGEFPALTGLVAARPGNLASNLADLVDALDVSFIEREGGLVARKVSGTSAIALVIDAELDCQASADWVGIGQQDRQRLAGDRGADCFEIGYYAVDREFQAGLQRVRRAAGQRVEQIVLPVAMEADIAKALAADLLLRTRSARLSRIVRLPWRHLGLKPGMVLRMSDSDTVWRIKEQRFEAFVVVLALERTSDGSGISLLGDGGRSQQFEDASAGPTALLVLELPTLGIGAPSSPKIQLVAAGVSSGWRRAAIEISQDGGMGFDLIGSIGTSAVFGQTVEALAPGPVAVWDRHAVIEVELLSERMWLEGMTERAILQGGNLALAGDELVQFAEAEAVGFRRFRLSRLLRGRRGTEALVAGHVAGERFALLRPGSILEHDLPLDAIGRSVQIRATGAGDADFAAITLVLAGQGLRPLSPAHLRLTKRGTDVFASWIRRSRAGFAWLDFADAPLGEESEGYEVIVKLDGIERRRVRTMTPTFVYTAAHRLDDGDGELLEIAVAQVSALVGPGSQTVRTIELR